MVQPCPLYRPVISLVAGQCSLPPSPEACARSRIRSPSAAAARPPPPAAARPRRPLAPAPGGPRVKRGVSASRAVEIHKAQALSQPRGQWKTQGKGGVSATNAVEDTRHRHCLSREGSGTTQLFPYRFEGCPKALPGCLPRRLLLLLGQKVQERRQELIAA